MRHFILDQNPNFSEATVTLDGHKYELVYINGNGGYFVEYTKDGLTVDEISLTREAMKALFLLLTTK